MNEKLRTSPGGIRSLPILGPTLKALASLQLTVVLFALSLFLVFFGTLAQMNAGIWTVMDQYFRSWYVWVPADLFVKFAHKFFYVNPSFHVNWSFPFIGGWLLGGIMLANLIAAHLVRFQITWKRSGILMLHSGVILLMIGELVTGLFAVESKMILKIGETANFVEETGDCELVITKETNPEKGDLVVTVPGEILRQKGLIEDERLPVTIEVLEYYKNSDIQAVKDDKEEGVKAHTGIRFKAKPVSEDSGVTTEARENIPTVIVHLRRKDNGELIEKKELSVWYSSRVIPLRFEQSFTLDGQTYPITLRVKRHYKPYTIHLLNFEHKKYPGTNTPKDFASTVQLMDSERGENRQVRIWMNNPLRYSGDTFYQSGVLQGDSGTILQVVRNPGALLPYVSCALISIGLLVHFSMSGAFRKALLRLSSNMTQEKVVKQSVQSYLPWVSVAVTALGLLMMAVPPKAGEDKFDLYAFGQIPIQDGGRVKPLDSFARTMLLKITEKQSHTEEAKTEDEKDVTIQAIKWLLDVMTMPISGRKDVLELRIFRIENTELLDFLNLERRKGLRYSYSEIEDKLDLIDKEANRAGELHKNDQSVFDVKVIELDNRVQMFRALTMWFIPRILPPPSKSDEDWTPLAAALKKGEDGLRNREARYLADILLAYFKNDPELFNKEVAHYLGHMREERPDDVSRVSMESWMNYFAPFYQCAMIYVMVLMLCIASWLVWHAPLQKIAFWGTMLALVVHSLAMIARMYISQRPPVTNLYSTAVFIGWTALPLCLFLESRYRNGVGTFVGAALGAITMLVAHHLEQAGDTLDVMQAVLDTNFWLATHVTSINLGYMSTFVAGIIGAIYILMGVFTPYLTKERSKAMGQMMYLVICISMFLSFTGTVLGGIWADQSWGRFWGWDPKENGALLIVIQMALILHARWCGLIKERGMALLALIGNMITVWSWFGTNQLGIGLHAYGFNEKLAQGCTITWIVHTVLFGIGCLPQRFWQSSTNEDLATES